ncbi:response regulator [Mucilaginibacter sp. Bleaf8]|uniref:response regulator n=1 Tax=Mucilaginibacter sp. Bleaf8 TaxID=2834430 RepID=UPI001BD1A490|nr:response regulator [Mucilaginibacter sp. Bleaf8]MBS7564034.1 response regulator [Mucilaginibacter sp. Bleaf8]
MSKIEILCVIDDDEIYTFTIKKIIKMADVTENTLFFENGQDALDFFTANKDKAGLLPELILLDLNMPILDGWQFLDKFKELIPHFGKKITVYIVSSSIDEADFKRAADIEQVSDFMVKPITVQQLRELVSNL